MKLVVCAASAADSSDYFWDVQWSASEKSLVVCGGRRILAWRWDLDSGLVKEHCIETVHTKSIRRLAIVEGEEPLLVACGFDSLVTFYAILDSEGKASGKENEKIQFKLVKQLEAHESEIKGLAVRRPTDTESLLIATCGRDKTVLIHGVYSETEKTSVSHLEDSEFYCVSHLTDHSQDVKSVRFHPNRPQLISASYDKSTRVYTEAEGDWAMTQVLEHHTDTVWDLTFSPDGLHFATCGADGCINVYQIQAPRIGAKDLASGAATSLMRTAFKVAKQVEQWQLEGYYKYEGDMLCGQPIYSVDWCVVEKEGVVSDFLALGCGDNSIRVLSRNRTAMGEWRQVAAVLSAHMGDVNCVRWSSHRSNRFPLHLASCGEDGILKIWLFD